MQQTTLTIEQASRFYNWLGSRQDWQSPFEDPAVSAMVEQSDFKHATSVFEFGCGTGRFAERLLSELLPPACRYLGIDVSVTMVNLAQQRLRRWTPRAEVRQSDGSCSFGISDSSVDRVVSTYVLDLMSPDQIRAFLQEAHRALTPKGLLCLVSLTDGVGPIGGLVSWLWTRIHAISPSLVGGCRPLDLHQFVTRTDWQVRHARSIRSFGVTSQVIVASPEKN